VQVPALGFVGVDAQVDRLMADRKMPSNLLRAPVAADVGLNATPKTGCNGFGIAAMAGALGRFAAGLFGSHKALDLVSFFSSEVFVHWATSTWRLKRP
jgi:hypothetical protein